MPRSRKTNIRMYSAWNYENEIENLNRLSAQGWQLEHGGSFGSRFVRNDEIHYIYQLDYQPGQMNLARYLETYREQGWEFVNNTFNGWYYFRKLYNPDLSEEEYAIFTDRASLKEMNGRWANIAMMITILLGVFLLIGSILYITVPMLPTLVLNAAIGVEFIMLLRGYLIMKDTEKSKNDKRDNLRLAVLFGVIIIGILASSLLRTARPMGGCHMSAEYYNPITAVMDNGTILNTFEVKYTDRYYLDLEVKADTDVTFSITDGAGKTVFEKTGSDYDLSNEKLKLLHGEYNVIISDFEGGALDIEYDFE